MSYYNGPKLDVSRLHRKTDGIIAVKVSANVSIKSSILITCNLITFENYYETPHGPIVLINNLDDY